VTNVVQKIISKDTLQLPAAFYNFIHLTNTTMRHFKLIS